MRIVGGTGGSLKVMVKEKRSSFIYEDPLSSLDHSTENGKLDTIITDYILWIHYFDIKLSPNGVKTANIPHFYTAHEDMEQQ